MTYSGVVALVLPAVTRLPMSMSRAVMTPSKGAVTRLNCVSALYCSAWALVEGDLGEGGLVLRRGAVVLGVLLLALLLRHHALAANRASAHTGRGRTALPPCAP